MSNKPKSTALYTSPFSKAYWLDAAAELKDTHMLVFAALMIALRLVLKQVLLRGSKGHNFDEFKTVINAMASGRISVKKYISRRIKLEEVQAGFEAMKAARGLDTKVIIETQ